MNPPPTLSARSDSEIPIPQSEVGSIGQPGGEAVTSDNHLHKAAALRKALADGSQSPDAIIRAAAETARTLTGADGIALALRVRGVVVCRARSGELAPDLGSQLNAQSGISGECLRSASIQLCSDTENDSRVDPEVCQAMGIRSIAAVPLRGPMGVAGILEGFSARPNAFGDEQIRYLRELALVAEAAYETERLAHEEETLARLRTPRLPAILRPSTEPKLMEPNQSTPHSAEEPGNSSSDTLFPRQYWVIGVAALALLLVLGVWLSWRDPASEPASAKPASPPQSLPESATTTATTGPAISEDSGKSHPNRPSTKTKKESPLLRNAAQIESTGGELASSKDDAAKSASPVPSVADVHPAKSEPTHTEAENPLVEPPQVDMPAQNQNQIAGLISSTETMPAADVRVSQGVTPAELIRKVDPVYPPQARMERISGSVELQITIAQDGSVGNVKQISGDRLLAAAAVNAVRKWRYVPVRLDGKPVQSDKKVTIVFKLPGD